MEKKSMFEINYYLNWNSYRYFEELFKIHIYIKCF